MNRYTGLEGLTNDDLIRDYWDHGEPVVQELLNRLRDLSEELEDERADFKLMTKAFEGETASQSAEIDKLEGVIDNLYESTVDRGAVDEIVANETANAQRRITFLSKQVRQMSADLEVYQTPLQRHRPRARPRVVET